MPAHQARNGTRYGAATAVQAAPRPIATPATAPVNSPSVAACAMPWPCEIVPSARPRATGCVIRQRSISQGPNAAPIIPVVTTKSGVSAGLALMALATSTAIGTVADLIDIEDVNSGVNAKARIVNLSGLGMLGRSVARQLGSGNSFARLLCCPAQAE